MFEATCREQVLRLHRESTRWLSTGWNGGFTRADGAHLITVPDDWNRVDLESYVAMRCSKAGFSTMGPALLTGVDVANARGARRDPVVAYATVGLSNPAILPMRPSGSCQRERSDAGNTGTVNLVVGTTLALDDATMAGLLATCVEAKAATLLATAGAPGTTSDAIAVAYDPSGELARFAGSSTRLGTAARACVREAVTAATAATYPNGPPDPRAAEHGVSTAESATVFRP